MAKKNATTRTSGYIISEPKFKGSDSSQRSKTLQLLRVTVSNVETKFDFGYQSGIDFDFGEWIKINPKTFIRPHPKPTDMKVNLTNEKSIQTFLLTNATNIPYGPEKYHFHSKIEWRYFSLHFPPLPEGVELIDLIEQENGNSNDFNFYGIKLDDKSRREMIY